MSSIVLFLGLALVAMSAVSGLAMLAADYSAQ